MRLKLLCVAAIAVASYAQTTTRYDLPAPPTATTAGGVQSKDCSSGGQFLQAINTNGTETCATPAGGGNVSGPGTVTNGFLPLWGASNNLLTVGLAVSTTPAANTVPEAGVGGTLAAGWIPAISSPMVGQSCSVTNAPYNADPTGATDSSTGINAALAACTEVFFPQPAATSFYKVTNLVGKTGNKLVGASGASGSGGSLGGVPIHCTSNTLSCFSVDFSVNGSRNIEISNVYFEDDASARTSGNAVDCLGRTDACIIQLENVNTKGFVNSFNAITIIAGSYIHGGHFVTPSNNGINQSGTSTSLELKALFIDTPGQDCIDLSAMVNANMQWSCGNSGRDDLHMDATVPPNGNTFFQEGEVIGRYGALVEGQSNTFYGTCNVTDVTGHRCYYLDNVAQTTLVGVQTRNGDAGVYYQGGGNLQSAFLGKTPIVTFEARGNYTAGTVGGATEVHDTVGAITYPDNTVPVHASDPANCPIGQLEFNSTSGAFKGCAAANTWSPFGGSGGGMADPGANGFMIRTGLNTSAAVSLAASSGITITNGSGIGTPLIGLDTTVAVTQAQAQTLAPNTVWATLTGSTYGGANNPAADFYTDSNNNGLVVNFCPYSSWTGGAAYFNQGTGVKRILLNGHDIPANLIIANSCYLLVYNATMTVDNVASVGAFELKSPVPGGPYLYVANAGSNGTTLYTLTTLTGAPSTAVIAGTSNTHGVVGVTVADPGTSLTAVIQQIGLTSCVFDGATTANHYVQASTTLGGDCHDAGSSWPSSGQVLGYVTTTNGSAGTYAVVLGPS